MLYISSQVLPVNEVDVGGAAQCPGDGVGNEVLQPQQVQAVVQLAVEEQGVAPPEAHVLLPVLVQVGGVVVTACSQNNIMIMITFIRKKGYTYITYKKITYKTSK